jgi:hypothetical protein
MVNMHLDYDWTYIAILIICVLIAVTVPPFIDPIHSIFLLVGAIITFLTFITSQWAGKPIGIKQIFPSNFLLQTAVTSVVLGLPVFLRPKAAIIITPLSLLIGITAEEVYRIASYKYIISAYEMPYTAILLSGIIFAAMHMYWYPTEWLFAITGGILFSATLNYFGSETSAVASHYLYDALCFGFVSTPFYFLLVALMGGVGYALRWKVKK